MKSLEDIFIPIKLVHQQFLLIFLTGPLQFLLGLDIVHLPFWALQKETKTQVAEDYASWGLTKCQCASCSCLWKPPLQLEAAEEPPRLSGPNPWTLSM